MKVKDLIEELGNFDDNQEVYFSYCYGDHWDTDVAQEIESVDLKPIKWSEYHRLYKVVDELIDSETEVIILS